VRFGYAPRLDGQGDRFGVDRIVLSPMLTNADLPDARGVEHPRPVSPHFQRVVHVPALPAGLESNHRRRRLRPQPSGQLRETSYRRSLDDLAVLHFAIRNVARAQVQSYASHDRPPLGPQPSGIWCL